MRVCRTCGESKPESEYGVHQTRRDRLQVVCKRCDFARLAKYKEAKKQRDRAAKAAGRARVTAAQQRAQTVAALPLPVDVQTPAAPRWDFNTLVEQVFLEDLPLKAVPPMCRLLIEQLIAGIKRGDSWAVRQAVELVAGKAQVKPRKDLAYGDRLLLALAQLTGHDGAAGADADLAAALLSDAGAAVDADAGADPVLGGVGP